MQCCRFCIKWNENLPLSMNGGKRLAVNFGVLCYPAWPHLTHETNGIFSLYNLMQINSTFLLWSVVPGSQIQIFSTTVKLIPVCARVCEIVFRLGT
jgi:hypothetical protein